MAERYRLKWVGEGEFGSRVGLYTIEKQIDSEFSNGEWFEIDHAAFHKKKEAEAWFDSVVHSIRRKLQPYVIKEVKLET